MSENEANSNSEHDWSTHENVHCIIWEFVKNHDEDMLRRLINYRCQKLVLSIFKQAEECPLRNVHTKSSKVEKFFIVKALFIGCADQLVQGNMFRFAEPQNFAKLLVGQLMISSTFTRPITRSFKQQAKIRVGSEGKFQEIFLGKCPSRTNLSRRYRWLAARWNPSKRQKRLNRCEDVNYSSHCLSKPSSSVAFIRALHLDDVKIDKYNKGLKEAKILQLLSTHFNTAFYFYNSRPQKQYQEYSTFKSH